MSNGLILDDVLASQSKSNDKQSIVKSKNSAFFQKDIQDLKTNSVSDKTPKDSKIDVEDNNVVSQSDTQEDNFVEFSATINSENRVYSNTKQGEYENKEFAKGVYETRVIFPDANSSEQVDIGKNHAKVRCSCPHYRFYYGDINNKVGFLSGGKFEHYQRKTDRENGKRNKYDNHGMCKHLIYFISKLLDQGLVVDSKNRWKQIIDTTSTPVDKYQPEKVKRIDYEIKQQKVKDLIANSKFLAQKSAKPVQGSSRETWERWVNDAYSKFMRLDRISRKHAEVDYKYGRATYDFDVSDLDIPGIDKLDKDNKTLSQLRKYWIGEYNRRVEDYLKHKGLDKTQINTRKTKTRDGLNAYVLPTKIGKRLKSSDVTPKSREEVNAENEVYRVREAKRLKAIKARQYMKSIAKQEHKTFDEVKDEYVKKATAKNMSLADYVWKLIKRNTEIEQEKETQLAKIERDKARQQAKQDALRKKEREINNKRAELNSLNLKIGNYNHGKIELSQAEVNQINKRRLELDDYLRRHVSGHVSSPDLNKMRMKDRRLNSKPKAQSKTKSSIEKSTIKKQSSDKIVKPKLKPSDAKVTNIENPNVKLKQNSIDLDDEESEIEIKRDKHGNVIIPEKPSKSAHEEDKLLYMKSIDAERNQLNMKLRHINSGHMKVKPDEKEALLKRIKQLSNDLIEAQDEYNISLDEI